MSDELAERNQAIVERYADLGNLSIVAREFGITRERVRQIVVAKAGGTAGRSRLYPEVKIRRLFSAVSYVARREHARRHGTVLRYNYGCSCVKCREAWAAYKRRWWAERHPNYKPRSEEARANIAAGAWPEYYAARRG